MVCRLWHWGISLQQISQLAVGGMSDEQLVKYLS